MQPTHNKLTKWLNKLQQESWQLELLISGFSIFLMLGAWQSIRGFRRDIAIAVQGLGPEDNLLNIGYGILIVSCLFIIINLILHVLLRGIWISTIGLRYVSGDIDFDSLRLAPRFDRLLRSKIGSFDKYILQLENICSVVFAFTFLIVFMLLALGMFIGAMVLTGNLLRAILPEGYYEYILIPTLILFALGGLLYFIDFLTLGFLKRIKWLSYIYLPFYQVMSLITLSFLHRPIYYNLIDNKFGRRVGFLLLPYVAIVMFLFSERLHSHTWYPDKPGKLALLNNDYDDQRSETSLITSGSIPSRFVGNGFLQLFIAYIPTSDDPVLKVICPGFKPFHQPGFETDLQFGNSGSPSQQRIDAADTALVCLSQMYEIHIGDSLHFNQRFRFHRHQNYGEYGLVTMLDVAYLPRGEHQVSVHKWEHKIRNDYDTLVMEPFFELPFWKE